MIVKDLTIEQYMKIMLISNSFKNDEHKLKAEILKVFYKDLSLSIEEGNETINSVFELIAKEPDLINRFKYNGKEWGFIPNLDTITTGEFIDLDSWMKEGKDLHRIAAILYRPIIKSKGRAYDIEKYEGTDKYAEELKGASFKTILGAMVFFCNLRVSLLKALHTYIEKQKKVKIN